MSAVHAPNQARIHEIAGVGLVAAAAAYALASRGFAYPWEDHLAIALELRNKGQLAANGVYAIFRPPGFPVMFGSFLAAWDALAGSNATPLDQGGALDRLHAFHAPLVGIFAAAAYALFRRSSRAATAGIAAMAVSLNPLTISATAVASYHLAFIVGAMLALQLAIAAPLGDGVKQRFADGFAWGALALVKPVTLVYPAVIALLTGRHMVGRVVAAVASSAGAAIVVAPIVFANWVNVGAPVLTSQGGFAIWGTSVEPIPDNARFLDWQSIWTRRGMQIYTETTGEREFDLATFNRESIRLNNAFAAAALASIRAAPQVYSSNVVWNAIGFVASGMQFWPRLAPARRGGDPLFEAVAVPFLFVLATLAGLGGFWGILARDRVAIFAFAVFCATIFAHAISFTTELYTIAKYPTLALWVGVFFGRLDALWGGAQNRIAPGMAAALVFLAWAIAATLVMTG